MNCRGGFLPNRLPCAPAVVDPSEWPVGQRIFERGIPLLPRSTICRGTDLVKYEVTKGTLTMASTTSEDPHAQYIAIYRKTRTFDKHVAWRYDDMRGSKYLPTVASLLADKVIREDEIVGFSDENREHILRSASIRYA